MRPALLAAAVATLLLFAGCGSSDEEAEPAAGSAQIVEISETEFALDPKVVTVDDPGPVRLRVVNDGAIVHALEVEGSGVEEETGDIEPGQSVELTLELSEGAYELYCPIGNHREQGMDGSLAVGQAQGTGTEPAETGADSSSGYRY